MNARCKDFLAMILIGDGVLNLIQPQRHTAIWNCGPRFYRESIRKLEFHPGAARILGFAFFAIGIHFAQSAAKISGGASRQKGRITRASEGALEKAKRSVDVEYEQGQARETRRIRRV